MQKNFVRLFVVLAIACVTSLAFAQRDFQERLDQFDREAAKVSGPELKLAPGESVNDVMNRLRDNLGAMSSAIGTPLENSTPESNQNATIMIVVGGVIAAALIASAIFFRGRKS